LAADKPIFWRLVRTFLESRSAVLGVLIAGMSLVIVAVWLLIGQPDLCAGVTELILVSERHSLALYGLLIVWSFCLFLTVLPLGTLTILLAGLLLGPMAGLAQFLALLLASAVVYEIGRERDPERLGRELAHYPRLLALAGLARRRGFYFISLMRIAPVVPSAVCCLGASLFGVSRTQFYGGTLATGWIRPVAFALLASAGRLLPVCDGGPLTFLSGA